MKIITDYIAVSTRGHADIKDITREAEQKLRASGLKHGTITFFASGATAGITTVEYEPGLLKDIPEMFDKIAPEGAPYHHDATWHDGNGNSHVRASLQGPSLVVPFSDGHMLLGTWQQVVLIDFDNRSRHRQVVLQIMGE
ncbi:YjbQ family protein [candidate division KSB1 bacterium]|nr:YjbQ family protein [candidate division KSB1 bacterium]RQW00157.1 MAG: YjbQ family protein [candidate division KSB1 bacterium]